MNIKLKLLEFFNSLKTKSPYVYTAVVVISMGMIFVIPELQAQDIVIPEFIMTIRPYVVGFATLFGLHTSASISDEKSVDEFTVDSDTGNDK